VPAGADDAAVIGRLLEDYQIEIASGLGDLEGEIFRIGCMGHSARPGNVSYLLPALGDALEREGADVDVEDGLAAMRARLGG